MTIKIADLSFSYGRTPVFDRFEFLTTARIVVVQGRNGTGKTTLLKLIAGILEPAGVAELRHPDPVGLVLQDDALLPWLTVRRNLDCVPSTDQHDGHLAPLREIIEPLMPFGAHTLSFGQRRVVELYRMLRGGFALICLDEPLNFLDVETGERVQDAILSLANGDVRFVIASHGDNYTDGGIAVIYDMPSTLPIRTLSQRFQDHDRD